MSQPIIPKPSVGRIVHYVLGGPADAETVNPNSTGEHRPAIIVRVRDERTVQLQVFTDGHNDRANHPEGLMWRTSVHEDEDTKAPGTWHWPERE